MFCKATLYWYIKIIIKHYKNVIELHIISHFCFVFLTVICTHNLIRLWDSNSRSWNCNMGLGWTFTDDLTLNTCIPGWHHNQSVIYQLHKISNVLRCSILLWLQWFCDSRFKIIFNIVWHSIAFWAVFTPQFCLGSKYLCLQFQCWILIKVSYFRGVQIYMWRAGLGAGFHSNHSRATPVSTLLNQMSLTFNTQIKTCTHSRFLIVSRSPQKKYQWE